MQLTSRRVTFLAFIGLTFFGLFQLVILTSKIANAQNFSWVGQQNSTAEVTPTSEQPTENCVHQNMIVDGEQGVRDVCLTQADGFRFGWYLTNFSYRQIVISFNTDSKTYKVNNLSSRTNDLIVLPGTNTLVYKQFRTYSSYNLAIYKNFAQRLTRVSNGLATEYQFNDTSPSYMLTDNNGDTVPIKGLGYSQNSRWLVVEVMESVLVRIDVASPAFDNKVFARPGLNQYYSSIQLGISNDGTNAIMGGRNVSIKVYELSDNCGQSAYNPWNSPYVGGCPSKNLDSFINENGLSDGYAAGFSFNPDGGQLSFLYNYLPGSSEPTKLVILTAAGYQPTTLDYLALGDSISSGEGDTEPTSSGQKHYLAYTDNEADYANGIPREKCHQSTRAWPFVLADLSGISEDKKETVACSGAMIGDLASSQSTYEGQLDGSDNSKPRLQGFSNVGALQTTALDDFVPGRVRQIDFMKKYKPKAVTLTISGNDVDFADILKQCISPSLSSCEQSDTDQGKATIGKSIANQYENLVTLYTRLHEASPETKIYAIGYPKFVSTGDSCEVNVQLDNEERNMAERAAEYLNDVIERSAQRAGVEYINIEDSLNGKRLCDTYKPYVTGIAGWMQSEKQESFHPTHKGNELIADKVKSELGASTLLTHRNCPSSIVLDFCPDSTVNPPEPIPYFANSINSYNRSVKNEQITNERVNKTAPQNVKVDPFSLQPGSNVTIELHSNPVTLGQYSVGQDGSLSEGVTIPSNVSAGYHSLHIFGNSYSGEPIDLMQIIEVRGAEGDIDEDGISDNIDSCLYVAAANTDTDFDGIDDACDPSITDPIIYQSRNGDPTKNEDPAKLYLERNTLASSRTGIANDYTEPNSHWALVGSSQDTQTSGTFNKLLILEDSQQRPLPTILMKDNTNQCVALQAQTLEQVLPPAQPPQTRSFTKLNSLPQGENCD